VLESDNGETGEGDVDGGRGNGTEDGPVDWDTDEKGGTGESCDVRSPSPVEPGSRNEKKLYERECL
jgi:hypothetical protein